MLDRYLILRKVIKAPHLDTSFIRSISIDRDKHKTFPELNVQKVDKTPPFLTTLFSMFETVSFEAPSRLTSMKCTKVTSCGLQWLSGLHHCTKYGNAFGKRHSSVD